MSRVEFVKQVCQLAETLSLQAERTPAEEEIITLVTNFRQASPPAMSCKEEAVRRNWF